jgi:hypothetical protein
MVSIDEANGIARRLTNRGFEFFLFPNRIQARPHAGVSLVLLGDDAVSCWAANLNTKASMIIPFGKDDDK